LDPEIANDKQLRQDYDYDVSRDVAGDDSLDIDDEYSELSGVVGMCRDEDALRSILSGSC
jgi:U3 small nucleolar ribonucleoprotein protein IMP4